MRWLPFLLLLAAYPVLGQDPTVRTEPTFPLTSGCTLVNANVYQVYTNNVNVDPFNPTYVGGAALGGTGGSDWQPSSTSGTYTQAETNDTTLASAIASAHGGGCVEVQMDSATPPHDALVEAGAPSTSTGGGAAPVNSSGQGIQLIIDAGVRIFASRNPADYGGGSCGTIGGSCNKWINVSGANNAAIMGYGILDGRGWSRAYPGNSQTSGFNYEKVLSYCRNHINSWYGVTCTGSSGGIANGPNMLNFRNGSSNITLYKITLYDSGQFVVYFGENNTNTLIWGVKIASPGWVSNTDGIDPSYHALDWTIQNSFISTGDNAIATKSDCGSSCKGFTPGATQYGTISGLQTSSATGVTIGDNASATPIGVSNILVDHLVQNGNQSLVLGNQNQQWGHGIQATDPSSGTIDTVTYQNTCISNMSDPSAASVQYKSTGPMTNISELNTTILKGSATGNSYLLKFQGENSSNKLGLTLSNVNANGALTYSNSNANITLGPNNVNFAAGITSAGGSGVTITNSITATPAPFPCVMHSPPQVGDTWNPLIGELSVATAAQHNGQSFVGPAPATYTLQAVLIPAMYVAGHESTAPTAGITFYDNGVALNGGTPVSLSHGNTLATLPLTGVLAGTHVYTAKYNVSGSDAGYPTAFPFGSLTANVSGSGGTGQIIFNGPSKIVGPGVIQ
jgi:polygalacturonase